VIRYESVIHEFDPWFNYRTTKFMTKEGLYGLWNWFDSESWYPLGRSVGGTVYPGLMMTSSIIYWFLQWIAVPMDIRNVCVFIAPVFSGFTALTTYKLTKEATGKSAHGLFSALFIAIVPSYISRSAAGSYDNEAIAIFALVYSFYTFLKAANSGSLFDSCVAAFAFLYMVASWGGYVFIINMIPIWVLAMIVLGKCDKQVYISYSVFYIIGHILSIQILFVGFQAITSSEHMLSHFVFIILQVHYLLQWIKGHTGQKAFQTLVRFFYFGLTAVLLVGFLYLSFTGASRWSGRSLTLLDPTYAKKFIPIVASVSEH